MKVLVLGCALLAQAYGAGVAGEPERSAAWRAQYDKKAEQGLVPSLGLRDQCHAQARDSFQGPQDPQSIWSPFYRLYVTCMKDNGWILTPGRTPDSWSKVTE